MMSKYKHWIIVGCTILFGICTFKAHAIEDDKKLHLGVSTVLSTVIVQATKDKEVAFTACMVIGVGKESYDWADYGSFSGGDLAYDAVGCALGTLTIEAVDVSYSGRQINFEWRF